jgi:hypothetical protein
VLVTEPGDPARAGRPRWPWPSTSRGWWGTAAVILAGVLNREGNWALILVGDVVLVFALLEGVALAQDGGLMPAAAGRG